jgi:hypothetical protein
VDTTQGPSGPQAHAPPPMAPPGHPNVLQIFQRGQGIGEGAFQQVLGEGHLPASSEMGQGLVTVHSGNPRQDASQGLPRRQPSAPPTVVPTQI